MRRIIAPQALITMLLPWGNLLIILLKSAALVSLITLHDLTFQAYNLNVLTFRTWELYSLTLLLCFVLAQAIALAVAFLYRRLSCGLTRGVVNDVFNWGGAWSIVPLLASGALVTFQSTVIGFILALAIALPLALGRRSRSLLLFIPATAVIEFIRSTPLLIQLYFIFFVGPQFGTRLSPLTAVLMAIGLYYSCFIAEVYRSGIDAVPRGQWEAIMALNMGRWRAYRAIILPQAIPPMIPALGNYLIDIFKATPIPSVITVLEMMTRAKMIDSESFRYTEPMTIVGAFFLIMTLGASFLVRRLEAQFGQSRSKTPVGVAGV